MNQSIIPYSFGLAQFSLTLPTWLDWDLIWKLPLFLFFVYLLFMILRFAMNKIRSGNSLSPKYKSSGRSTGNRSASSRSAVQIESNPSSYFSASVQKPTVFERPPLPYASEQGSISDLATQVRIANQQLATLQQQMKSPTFYGSRLLEDMVYVKSEIAAIRKDLSSLTTSDAIHQSATERSNDQQDSSRSADQQLSHVSSTSNQQESEDQPSFSLLTEVIDKFGDKSFVNFFKDDDKFTPLENTKTTGRPILKSTDIQSATALLFEDGDKMYLIPNITRDDLPRVVDNFGKLQNIFECRNDQPSPNGVLKLVSPAIITKSSDGTFEVVTRGLISC